MYRKELPVGDRVTEEPSSADDIGDQLLEYDSDSSNEEDSATHEEDAVEAVPVNFLSKTVRMRTGRPGKCEGFLQCSVTLGSAR